MDINVLTTSINITGLIIVTNWYERWRWIGPRGCLTQNHYWNLWTKNWKRRKLRKLWETGIIVVSYLCNYEETKTRVIVVRCCWNWSCFVSFVWFYEEFDQLVCWVIECVVLLLCGCLPQIVWWRLTLNQNAWGDVINKVDDKWSSLDLHKKIQKFRNKLQGSQCYRYSKCYVGRDPQGETAM